MYIGNTPAENYASFLTETFSVSATASYTLSHAVTNENDIRLVINGVVQQPGSGKAYTASGTTLTLTSATVSGDVMYAVYLGRALQTVNPPNASVGTAQLADSSVTSAKLGTGATNTPAFLAHSIAQQDISDNTFTKVQFTSEDYDTDNTYDNSSNYRFTPGVAGKYNLYSQVGAYGISNTSQSFTISIYKNGTDYIQQRQAYSSNAIESGGTYALHTNATVDVGASDYFEVFLKVNSNGTDVRIDYNSTRLYTFFGAYKIIGA
jgi:hypothetical protein